MAFSGILTAGLVASLPIPAAVAVGVVVRHRVRAGQRRAGGPVRAGALRGDAGLLTTIRGLAFVYSEVPIAPEDPAFFSLGSAMAGPVPISTVIMFAVFLVGGCS